DVSDVIDEHRDELPFSDQLPSFDPPMHTAHGGLLMRLITPKRLSENEEFMWRLCDQQLDEFLDKGECEFISEFASPFTLLVIADLEGVPESDHSKFKARLGNLIGGPTTHNPLEFLYDQFTEYVVDRRKNPREDVLTGLATATFPDGSTRDAKELALIAGNVFAAGHETTVRLLSFALQLLGAPP